LIGAVPAAGSGGGKKIDKEINLSPFRTLGQSLFEIVFKALSSRAVHLRGGHVGRKENVLPPYCDEELDLTPQFRGRLPMKKRIELRSVA
jgi:hypothetical protein